MIAEPGVDSLVALAHRKRWVADRGRHGSGARRRGRSAEDLVILVPPGTVISDANEHFVMRDLAAAGDQVVVAHGGKGGKGNWRFRSAVHQAPREHTPGGDGEHRLLVFELKSIADVGLIGKPNAGKSTLLSRLTRARPEIANYPFTTKHPNLGRVTVDFDRSFILADIPGLIEGAHQGVGLGHEFLRHIERAGILVHLIEPQPMDGTAPVDNYHHIRDELVRYKEQLGQRPEIVVVTKSELPGAAELRDSLAAELGPSVLLVSAVTGDGMNHLIEAICATMEGAAS